MIKNKGMKSRVQEYENAENLKVVKVQQKIDELRDDLYYSKASPSQRIKRVKQLIKEDKIIKRSHIYYDRFIMDVRKPSFFWFCMWVLFSIYGLIQLIINLIKYFI
jgi:hypothetical protein